MAHFHTIQDRVASLRMVDFNVDGKTAVITGGTRGLGLYCAEALMCNGASNVIITSRKSKACLDAAQYLEEVARQKGLKCRVLSFAADLAVEESCERFHRFVAELVKKVDILIANAGATWGAPLEEHSLSAFKKVIDLNLTAVFHCIQLFTPMLEESGTAEDPARIIIMSSIASLVANEPFGTYGYLSSKIAVSHLGKNLAVQLGRRNINVNSLAPGFFPSKMSNGLLEVVGESMVSTNPKGRLGTKEDIENTIVFLCAKQSCYINGVVLPLDGGGYLNAPSTHL